MNIVWKKTEELKAYENNARKITDAAIEYVKTSIGNFGYLNPIVIDAHDVVVCGHVTLEACRRLDIPEVPCVLADDLTPAQIKAFRLADNKVATMAIWDKDKLKQEFEFLVSTDFTFDQLGFEGSVMAESQGVTFQEGGGSVDTPKNTSEEVDLGEYEDDKFEHTCPHCGLKFNV